MYERIKALYLAGKLGLEQLAIAVGKGWITAEQETEIAAYGQRDTIPE